MRIRSFLRSHPLRSLGALAIVLPLGLDPSAHDLAGGTSAVPEDLLADVRAVAAVGAVLHPGPESTACASVVVRQSERAPRLVQVEWRSLDRDPVSGQIVLHRDADSDLEARGAGLELWQGCATISRPLREGRLFLTVEQKATDHRSAAHRIASVEMRAGKWTWRPLRDLPETRSVGDADGPAPRPRNDTYRADGGSSEGPGEREAAGRSRGR